ncbi:MAG: DUF692 domain-containing protein [Myxococcales bacterium]|nr:DUF692 domain-containing protein [Myxococcales bacterium]
MRPSARDDRARCAALDREPTTNGGRRPDSRVAQAELPTLGVGIGYRSAFAGELLLQQKRVDFLEIVADHYLDANAERRAELARLRGLFTLVPHALDLSLGGVEGPDPRYLEQLAALIELVEPPWWSEHIAFTRAGGVSIGHLAPLPCTNAALDQLCANIERVRAVIHRPLVLENVTYVIDLPSREMDDATFIARLLEASDCGLLLDVTNLFINARNHGFDATDFLDALPPERVVQLHFVGAKRRGSQWVDSHADPVNEEIWQLLGEVMRRFPVKGAILERDANWPRFAELAGELERARALGREAGRWS